MTPPPLHRPSLPARMLAAIRNNFFAGVVVIAPIGLTVWLIWTAVGWVDSVVMPFVPRYWHPDATINRWLGNAPGSPEWIDVNIRGVGVVFFLLFTVLIGWVARGLVGRSLLRTSERMVDRLPVVRSIYNAVKQIAETVFNQAQVKFDRVCLVEFPRSGVWSVAFMMGTAKGEIRDRLSRIDDYVTVYLPTTPNPTNGFLMYVRRSELILLDMSFEDAAKVIISGGLVNPDEDRERAAPVPAPAPAPQTAPTPPLLEPRT